MKDIETFIKEKLSSNKIWAIRALVRVYYKQTEDERVKEETVRHNNVGFTGSDAQILTSFAKQYFTRHFLSEKQIKLLFKKMPKYWLQIYSMCNRAKLDKLMKPKNNFISGQLSLFEPKIDLLSNYHK